MTDTISIIQIVIAVALIILILLQQSDSDSAGFLGGGGGGGGNGFYQQRRGLERLFFALTIILIVAFAALALTSLLYNQTPTSNVTPVAGPSAGNTVTTNEITTPAITIVPSASSTPKK